MKALLIVDLQNDFCPGGKLAVPEGDQIVAVINELLAEFPLVIASKDWHPEESIHFEKWPHHCLQKTAGAEFHPDLKEEKINKVFFKGTENKDDGYSAFEASNEDLKKYLEEHGVTDLYITGLATDYCVKATALDAVEAGFNTYLIKDAVAGIDEKDVEKAFAEMEKKGIKIISQKNPGS